MNGRPPCAEEENNAEEIEEKACTWRRVKVLKGAYKYHLSVEKVKVIFNMLINFTFILIRFVLTKH